MTDPDSNHDLIRSDERGLVCPRGEFHIDPWAPAPIAVITHAHSDHARPGSGRYIAAAPGADILRRRLGPDAHITPIDYGEPLDLGAVRISLHPAGHCLGSAQVRIEDGERVAVAAGDYKRAADPSCAPFEVIPCHQFVTEATFALPVYRWDSPTVVIDEIVRWWGSNREQGKVSVLLCYALGKAQRLLAELHRAGAVGEPIFVHGALAPLIDDYRAAGVELPTTFHVTATATRSKLNPYRGKLVLAPPSAAGSPWMRRFGPAKNVDIGFVSGWMRIRGIRRRRGYDRGFVLSDHADWPDLLQTIHDTGAQRILCTHGYTSSLARHLSERGLDAFVAPTQYDPEDGE